MNFDFSDELLQLRDQARRFLGIVARPPCLGASSIPKSLTPPTCGVPSQKWAGPAPQSPRNTAASGSAALPSAFWPRNWAGPLPPFLFPPRCTWRQRRSCCSAPNIRSRLAAETRHRRGHRHLRPGRTPRHIRSCKTDRLGHRRPPDRTKLAVPDGDIADIAIVAAKQRPSPCGPARPWGHPRNRYHLRSHALARPYRVRRRARGTTARQPDRNIRRLLDYAAVPMAFEQVGNAQAALDMANAYAKERFAFGRPIGSFQGIKHKLADMYIQVELARSNAYYGAWAVHTDAAELPDRRLGRPHRSLRGRLVRYKGKHPDPWRHGLHLADGLSSILPARQTTEPGLGRCPRMEAAADQRTAHDRATVRPTTHAVAKP